MSWLAVIVPVLTGTGGPTPKASAAADSPGSITLHVQSARSVADGAGFVHQGDPVTHYKWLVNVDDTGDPGTAAQPGTEKCLPPGAPAAAPTPTSPTPARGPRSATPRGTRRSWHREDQDDLNDGTALDGLPAGKYLISVTADDFKIDGAHFTVAPGHPAGHRPDEPDATAADHDPDPGLRGPGPGRRDVRGGRRARAERLRRAPHRRLRRGQHRLLRQRAVHHLPARRR